MGFQTMNKKSAFYDKLEKKERVKTDDEILLESLKKSTSSIIIERKSTGQ